MRIYKHVVIPEHTKRELSHKVCDICSKVLAETYYVFNSAFPVCQDERICDIDICVNCIKEQKEMNKK